MCKPSEWREKSEEECEQRAREIQNEGWEDISTDAPTDETISSTAEAQVDGGRSLVIESPLPLRSVT